MQDNKADLLLHGYVDDVMVAVLQHLGLSLPTDSDPFQVIDTQSHSTAKQSSSNEGTNPCTSMEAKPSSSEDSRSISSKEAKPSSSEVQDSHSNKERTETQH